MPNLPTFSVTDAQATRMLSAFGSTDAYIAWLKQSIIDFVIEKEINAWSKAELAAFDQRLQARIAQLKTDLTT